MIIEFQAPHGEVESLVYDYLRDQLLVIHEKDKDISRAQVYFRNMLKEKNPFVCEIELTIYGNSLFAHRDGQSYLEAAKAVIELLTGMVEKQINEGRNPSDKITSTVKI